MFGFFATIYTCFFIYLNYSIYKFLESGFKQNKKLILIAMVAVLMLSVFHKIFHFEGMMKSEAFVLLLIFSLSSILLHYMFKAIRYNMDNRLQGSNPKLYESNFYDTYKMIIGLVILYVIPVMITIFQIGMIVNPELQKEFYLK